MQRGKNDMKTDKRKHEGDILSKLIQIGLYIGYRLHSGQSSQRKTLDEIFKTLWQNNRRGKSCSDSSDV